MMNGEPCEVLFLDGNRALRLILLALEIMVSANSIAAMGVLDLLGFELF